MEENHTFTTDNLHHMQTQSKSSIVKRKNLSLSSMASLLSQTTNMAEPTSFEEANVDPC
jgi:hypothetical protein